MGMEQRDNKIDRQAGLFDVFISCLSSNTDDIYMLLDPEEERIEYISPNVERVLGVSEAEALADPKLIGAADGPAGKSPGFARLREMKPGESLEPVLTQRVNVKTKEHRWFREVVCCAALEGRNKIAVYISDRTQERQTQDALTQALDMAEVANRAKTSFLGNMSHDIRTPMNAIMGLTMLLKEETDNPERVREYTHRIDVASQHLLSLINDVLDMNKIEDGSTTLNISEFTLAEVIEELNTILRPQAKAKDQLFEISASPFTYEHLLGDKLRINQILINILSNAVKYTPEGGRVELIVTELSQRMKDHSHIRFIVRDNGQGMSEEYLKVIFDPFTREQNARTNLIQGTGLGMAITKSLVDLMGGSIQVDSVLGKGSVFTVELDFRIQEKADDKDFWKNNNVRRMIVADDQEEVCRNVVKAMARTGVTVDYAVGGREALRVIGEARERGEPYDLILLDWKMPDLNGLETARLIRKDYSAKIPILFFSAYDWRDIEQEAAEVGVSHFLPKPFFLYTFRKAIAKVIGSGAKKEQSSLSRGDSVVSGKRFLVVDDVEVNRMILVKILNTLGAVCDTAENGKIALDKFTDSQPGEFDIILRDVQMPVMDGHAATRAIRASAHPEARSVSIIAMTANAFVDDVRDALAAGMDAHVSKPIVLDQLKRTIQEVLERKGQSGNK